MRLPPRAGASRSGFAPLLLPVAVIAFASVPMPRGPGSGTGGAATHGDPGRGAELFGEKGCNGCHRIRGVGGAVGPDLTRVFRLDLARDRPGNRQSDVAAYVRQSVLDPQAYIVPRFPDPSPMPSAQVFGLSERDIDDLVAYLRQAAGPARTN